MDNIVLSYLTNLDLVSVYESSDCGMVLKPVESYTILDKFRKGQIVCPKRKYGAGRTCRS